MKKRKTLELAALLLGSSLLLGTTPAQAADLNGPMRGFTAKDSTYLQNPNHHIPHQHSALTHRHTQSDATSNYKTAEKLSIEHYKDNPDAKATKKSLKRGTRLSWLFGGLVFYGAWQYGTANELPRIGPVSSLLACSTFLFTKLATIVYTASKYRSILQSGLYNRPTAWNSRLIFREDGVKVKKHKGQTAYQARRIKLRWWHEDRQANTISLTDPYPKWALEFRDQLSRLINLDEQQGQEIADDFKTLLDAKLKRSYRWPNKTKLANIVNKTYGHHQFTMAHVAAAYGDVHVLAVIKAAGRALPKSANVLHQADAHGHYPVDIAMQMGHGKSLSFLYDSIKPHLIKPHLDEHYDTLIADLNGLLDQLERTAVQHMDTAGWFEEGKYNDKNDSQLRLFIDMSTLTKQNNQVLGHVSNQILDRTLTELDVKAHSNMLTAHPQHAYALLQWATVSHNFKAATWILKHITPVYGLLLNMSEISSTKLKIDRWHLLLGRQLDRLAWLERVLYPDKFKKWSPEASQLFKKFHTLEHDLLANRGKGRVNPSASPKQAPRQCNELLSNLLDDD